MSKTSADINADQSSSDALVVRLTRLAIGIGGAAAFGVIASLSVPAFPVAAALGAAAVGASLGFVRLDAAKHKKTEQSGS